MKYAVYAKKMNLTASFDGKDIGFIDNERTRLW